MPTFPELLLCQSMETFKVAQTVSKDSVNIFSTDILASHSSYSLAPLGVVMRSSQLLIGLFYLF